MIAVAAYFLIRTDYDDAFVTGVLGVCSFFLSIRFTFKPRVDERISTRLRPQDEPDDQTATKGEQE